MMARLRRLEGVMLVQPGPLVLEDGKWTLTVDVDVPDDVPAVRQESTGVKERAETLESTGASERPSENDGLTPEMRAAYARARAKAASKPEGPGFYIT